MPSRCAPRAVASSSQQRGRFHLEASAPPQQQQWRPKPRKIPCPNRPGSSRKTAATIATAGPGETSNRRKSKSDNAAKLQELKLAFGLLSREIQGLDGQEGDQCLPRPPATESTGAVTEGDMRRNEASKPLTPAVKNTDTPPPSAVATEEAPPQQSPSGLAAAANLPAKKATTSHPRVEQRSNVAADGLDIMRAEQRNNAAADGLDRVRAASHAEGRKAAEAAAKQAKQSLKQLDLELENERRARTAAESALHQLQLRATESDLEREKLQRVLASFGGRSLEEITVASQLLERRLRDAETALVDSQQLTAAKAAEGLEALEQAASLAEQLETERVARAAAEEARRSVTQELRCCLRGRANAEQQARAATAALKKSEAQRESLTQRLEVLRAANKRLDKRVAAVAQSSVGTKVKSNAGGGGGATGDSVARLAAARARLKVLSTSGGAVSLNDTGNGRGQSHAGEERAAVERAVGAVLAEKQWRDKLRNAEMQGEVFQSAARASETGMKIALRQKAELEEMNRVLVKQLAGEMPAEERELIDRTADDEDVRRSPAPLVVGTDGESTYRDFGEDETTATLLPRAMESRIESERQHHASATQCWSGVSYPAVERAAGGTAAAATPTPLGGYSITPNQHASGNNPEMEPNNIIPDDLIMADTTVTMQQPTEPCNDRSRQEGGKKTTMPPSPSCVVPQQLRSAAVKSYSVDACRSGTTRTSSPWCHDQCRSRPRSASASPTSPSTCTTTPTRVRCEPQQQRHHHQQQGDGMVAARIKDACRCSSSAAPFNQLLLESKKIRDEVLSAVRNGPLGCEETRSKACSGGNGSGDGSGDVGVGGAGGGDTGGGSGDRGGGGGGGGDGDGGYSGSHLERVGGETAIASVPIEVLLRLCDRGARKARREREGGVADSVVGGEKPIAGSVAANEHVDREGQTGESSDRQSLTGSSPVRDSKITLGDDGTHLTSPLPPGITRAFAQQVQGAVARGDERGFLDIVGRCGSTAREGIAMLLAIDFPE